MKTSINKNFRNLIIIIAIFFFICCFLAAFLSVQVFDNYSKGETLTSINKPANIISRAVNSEELKSNIRTASLEGNTSTLVISSSVDITTVETWYFSRNGYLCSASTNKGVPIVPEHAKKLYPIKNIGFVFLQDNLLEVTLTSKDNITSTFNLSLLGREDVPNE